MVLIRTHAGRDRCMPEVRRSCSEGGTQAPQSATECPDCDASLAANVGIGTLGHGGVQGVKRNDSILRGARDALCPANPGCPDRAVRPCAEPRTGAVVRP